MKSLVLERQKYLCFIIGKCFGHSSAFFLECFFSSLASNNDNHNILHELNRIGLYGENVVATLAPSFSIGSSSFLLETNHWMSSNLNQNRLFTSELLAIERRKKSVLHLVTAITHAVFLSDIPINL